MPRRALLVVIAIAACVIAGLIWLWPSHGGIPNLPQGQQTVSGTLNRAPLSLTRRGTHVLSQNGERVSMVESAAVALDRYEGQTVTLHGTFEANTDAISLPVFVVASIDTALAELRNEAIPSLGLTFTVPADWRRGGTEPALTFTAADGTTPILKLAVQPGNVLPAESNLSISSRLAQRTVDPKTGSAAIIVQLENARILTLSFAPLASDPVTALERLSLITRSLKFVGQTASGGPVSGSGAALPCGGTAGILCPKGFSCQITDVQNRVGTCAPLSPKK